MNKRLLAPLTAVLLSACGSSSNGDSDETFFGDESSAEYEDAREPFDESATRERAEEEVADEGYSGPCTMDCSGHEAGFQYAAEGHSDGGVSSSASFDEGQEAYEEAVEARVEEYRQAYDDGDEQ